MPMFRCRRNMTDRIHQFAKRRASEKPGNAKLPQLSLWESARILNDLNGFSDETANAAGRYINRLEVQSEQTAPRK
jgi:hypothetical protein